MWIFTNFDLLTVGIAVASIGLLGFIVYFNNPKSLTNETFLVFSLVAIFWSLANYSNYQVGNEEWILVILRLVMYFAVWYCYFLFQLFFVFPEDHVTFPKYYKYFVFPITLLTSFIALTPFVLSTVTHLAPTGEVSTVSVGPGIFLFGAVVISLIIGSLVVLYKKIRKAPTLEKIQLRYILLGALLTFSLHIIFNFILPAFFGDTRFIPLGALFTFPLIVLTTYAILKHHLLNLKIITTEILTFFLTIAILLDVVVSQDPLSRLFRFSIFLLVLGVGISLINSVRREVEQREQLQKLTLELEDANDKLKVLDQARAEFISIASHQLRTPPATIKWYLSAILAGDYGKVPKDILEQLKKAEQTNNHLISLIEDMLNVSRIERGKMEFLFEPTNVEELARFSFEQLLPIAHDKKLQLTYEPPTKPLPKIMADKEKLRQVMNNLIDNALKYTKQGSIEVNLSATDADIRFSVKDTGKGISPEEKNTIFDKYTRGKESVKQSAGLGLGLYVAKIIVEQHKGKIWAESVGEGKGSLFIFTIPINNGLKQTTLVDLAPKAVKK
jgi:signal transduction histidine kinase